MELLARVMVAILLASQDVSHFQGLSSLLFALLNSLIFLQTQASVVSHSDASIRWQFHNAQGWRS